MAKAACSVCGALVDTRHLANPQKLEDPMVELIRRDHPNWDGKRGVCPKCREQYRAKKFYGYLEAEYQKLTEMEHNLVSKIVRRTKVSKEVHAEYEEKMTVGERVADQVALFGGSWSFIFLFGSVLLGWMFLNAFLLVRRPFDPYPFILLNLVLSALAALQAPVIMMSQNRQAAKDRLQAQHDYEINLMAEIEIRDLHDKVDALRLKQWHELWQMQQQQLELLEAMRRLLVSPQPSSAPLPAAPPASPQPAGPAQVAPPVPPAGPEVP